jgi:hypothetical protein
MYYLHFMLITINYFLAENNSNFVNLPIITKFLCHDAVERRIEGTIF